MYFRASWPLLYVFSRKFSVFIKRPVVYELEVWKKNMASEFKVEVIHRETVEPSTPTPNHLRISNFSVFDQLVPQIYVPLLLFYPTNIDDDDEQVTKISDHNHSLVVERSKLLKTSLSETLTHFHAFAGTIQENVSISCNDRGVAFIEARVNYPLSKILIKPDLGLLKQLITDESTKTEDGIGYLLLVQVNYFECGGMAIGVNISHKIMDAYTLNTFLNSWAAIACASSTTSTADRVVHHLPDAANQFGAAVTLFPPLDFLKHKLLTASEVSAKEKCVTKRYVFDASKIVALKSRSASATVPNPTRVEVVSSLIWKCLMEASRENCGYVRPSAWCQAVNLRSVLLAQQHNYMGNFVGRVFTLKAEAENDDLQSLVGKLRKGIEEYKLKYGNGIIRGEDVCQSLKKYGELMHKDDLDGYGSTSWCRFPLYGADFGWGKPSWMCIPTNVQVKNIISFMDTRDGGGIEARLTLREEDMATLESNQELLAYASLNPTVI